MEIILRKHWTKLSLAAARGDPDAQWEMGYLHESGAADRSGKCFTPVDFPAALKWYEASAAQGNSDAQNALSILLSSGGEFGRNYPLAIHWAKMAVAQGNRSAAFNLGTIYRDLDKPKKAFRWYQRASAMGGSDAFLQVGLCYLFGLGTHRDYGSALSSFERIINDDPANSCQRSKENARYWIAVLHLMRGKRSKKSIAKIRSLLEVANADGDHEQANELLNLIGKTAYAAAV